MPQELGPSPPAHILKRIDDILNSKPTPSKEGPGISLEKAVVRIQQMMDPGSTVTHNERLEDRVGNKRQYDVVIRGSFAGRTLLGVIECKDHGQKQGPSEVEAFAKKTDNLRANLKLMVSRLGFTERALLLARHEGIGCLSLLPNDSTFTGLDIGYMWYGRAYSWRIKNMILFADADQGVAENSFTGDSVKFDGLPIINWFRREFIMSHKISNDLRQYVMYFLFDSAQRFEVGGKDCDLTGVGCVADRVCINKKKWIKLYGDASIDWHSRQLTIPPEGIVYGSAVETNLAAWDDYDGIIPDETSDNKNTFPRLVMTNQEVWDHSMQVPDLEKFRHNLHFQ